MEPGGFGILNIIYIKIELWSTSAGCTMNVAWKER